MSGRRRGGRRGGPRRQRPRFNIRPDIEELRHLVLFPDAVIVANAVVRVLIDHNNRAPAARLLAHFDRRDAPRASNNVPSDETVQETAARLSRLCYKLARALASVELAPSALALAHKFKRASMPTLRDILLSRYLLEIDTFVRNLPRFFAPHFRCPLKTLYKHFGDAPADVDGVELSRHSLYEIVRNFGGGIARIEGWWLELVRLTPHDVANERVFGHFRCCRCVRGEWCSPNAWPDTWQRCLRCKKEVYPYRMELLLRGDDDDGKAGATPHPSELCGKCRALGRSCVVRDEDEDQDDNAGDAD